MQLEGHSSKMMLYVLRSVLKNNFSVYIAGLFFVEELISNWNQSKKSLGGGGVKIGGRGVEKKLDNLE